MALYVYVTEKCLKDAKKHSYTEQVEKFKAQVEKLQDLSRFDHFPPPPYLKKRFERQIRMVANFKTFRINDEDHIVVTFLSIFIRGGGGEDGYISFKNNPVAFGEKYFKPLVTEEKLEEYLRMMLDKTPISPLSIPNPEEYDYLYKVQGNVGEQATEEMICESKKWVQFTSNKDNKFLLAIICAQLLELYKRPEVCC